MKLTDEVIVAALKDGKKVTQKLSSFEWFLYGDWLTLCEEDGDGTSGMSALDIDDLLSDDWEVVE